MNNKQNKLKVSISLSPVNISFLDKRAEQENDNRSRLVDNMITADRQGQARAVAKTIFGKLRAKRNTALLITE